MRTIKFRAKRIDNGRWVYGQYFRTPLTDENSGTTPDAGWFFLTGEPRNCIAQDGISFVVDEKTLSQYTGLKDKNGKEIYENDIIYLKHETGYYEWDESKEVVIFTMGSFSCSIYATPWDECDCEVIGNIYDNLELLEAPSE